MFRYNAKSKEEYLKYYKYLRNSDVVYNFLAEEMKDTKVIDSIKKLLLDDVECTFRNSVFCELSFKLQQLFGISEINLINENVVLLLMNCEKINKNLLLREILHYFLQCGPDNKTELLKTLEVMSAFISFESELSNIGKPKMDEVIIYLIEYKFPLTLFGKYGSEWVDFYNQKMNIVELSLFDFPLDVLDIIKQFIPFEKFVDSPKKSDWCTRLLLYILNFGTSNLKKRREMLTNQKTKINR